MQITLYKNFSKRRNSTKHPIGGTTANVVFKDGCSTENPVFLINGVDLDVNYVGFNSGYYYVDDIVLGNNNIYELHCSIDVLATWRSLIGSYNAFIERAASAYDDKINDVLLSSEQLISGAGVGSTDIGLTNAGCYIFRTISNEGIQVYATDSMQLLGGIYSNDTYGTTDAIWDSIVKSIGLSAVDAAQYLLNVMWVPYAMSALSGSTVNSVDLGFWEYTIPEVNNVPIFACKKLSELRKGTATALVLPVNAYTDFRRYSPKFSQYSLYLPGVGTVQLNSLDGGRGNITLIVEVDLVSGAIGYILRDAGSGNYIATYNGQLGVNIPMVSTNVNSAGFIESMVGTAASAVVAYSKYGTGAALASVAAGSIDAIQTIGNEQGSINGYNGNIGLIRRSHNVLCSLQLYGSKEFPITEAGRPLCEHRVINTLSGYIKCGAASIDIPGAAPNKDAVNAYLNSGFYYE